MNRYAIGVKIFAAYFLLFGLLNFSLGSLAVFNGGFYVSSSLDLLVSVYAYALSPFLLAVGIGLFLSKEWARKGFIIITIIKIAFTVLKSFLLFALGELLLMGVLFGIVFTAAIHGLMIWFFILKNVKEIFQVEQVA